MYLFPYSFIHPTLLKKNSADIISSGELVASQNCFMVVMGKFLTNDQ